MRSIIILLAIGLSTCRAPVVFQEIQPAGLPNASGFPRDLQGTYFAVDRDSATVDSEFVVITAGWITVRNIFSGVIYTKDTFSMRDMVFRHDSVYLPLGDELLPSGCRFQSDSARVRFQRDRSLFTFTDTSFLRIFDDKCFLNFKTGSGFYTDLLWRSGDTLVHGSIADKNEMNRMEPAAVVFGDPVIAKPTRNQLLQFIRSGGFSARDKFIKSGR